MIFFQFCGRRLSLCLFACLESEYELGFLMVRMMSPEDAQNMRTCHNETLIHMNWRKTLVCDNNGIFRRDDPTALLRMAQYAQFVVLILNVPIDAQITLDYNVNQGQHPLDYEMDEEYNPDFEDRGGYTSLMLAIKRRSFGMAGVLGDLGADWHTLVNADGQTAYDMLRIAAEEEQFTSGPNNTVSFVVPNEIKRTLRSLVRLYKPIHK